MLAQRQMMSGYEIPQKDRIDLRQQQMHVYYDSVVNYTHLTVGGSKVAKIDKTTYSCFKWKVLRFWKM